MYIIKCEMCTLTFLKVLHKVPAMKWSFSDLFGSLSKCTCVVWFWHSVALCGMNYGTYKRKRELFFLTLAEKPLKKKLIVNHSPSAAG